MECMDKRVKELAEIYEIEHSTKLTKEEIEFIKFGFDQALLDIAWGEHSKN